jgi:hypothetical protein
MKGKEADVEGLLHKTLKRILVGAPSPEQTGQRNIDDDEGRAQIGDLTLEKAEAGIDVGGESIEEGVDDADIVHGAPPPDARGAGAAASGSDRADVPKNRWRFSSQTARQCRSSASQGPSKEHRRNSAGKSLAAAEADGAAGSGGSSGRWLMAERIAKKTPIATTMAAA